VVGVGLLLVFVGFALLAGLTVAGAVLGTGFAAYRWLRGARPHLPSARETGLDPALEVLPRRQAIDAPSEPSRDADEPREKRP
jgi:hypothetical protein